MDEAERTKQILAPDRIRALRERARRIEAVIPANQPPERLWPYLSQVDEINRAGGSSPVQYAYVAQDAGPAAIRAGARKAGLTLHYLELPYEWITGEYLHGELIFERGPLEYARIRYEVEPNHRQARYLVDYVPRGRLPLGALFARRILHMFVKVAQGVDERLADEADDDALGLAAFCDRSPQARRRGQALAAAWNHLAPNSGVPGALADFVCTAPPSRVARIRPFELARLWGLDRTQTLRFCLQAVAEGFLNLRWDVICPNCQGAKLQVASLAEVDATVHCDACNIRFGADFGRNVEASFHPVDRVRRVPSDEYCLQSPSHQRHIFAQLNLEPQASLTVPLPATPGHHELRVLGVEGNGVLALDPALQAGPIELRLDEIGTAGVMTTAPGAALTLNNPSPFRRTVRIERNLQRDDAASAVAVTSLQEFRDRFGHDALRPGVQLGVENLTVLFTDIKDAARLYRELGDVQAFSLVQDHIDIIRDVVHRHEGALVKTIGDAVLASFARSEDGAVAAVEILDAIARWNERREHEPRVALKIGLYAGPCLAVTQNGRLDYSGLSVNQAARLKGLSRGGEIVMPARFLDEPAVREITATHAALEVDTPDASAENPLGAERVAVVRHARYLTTPLRSRPIGHAPSPAPRGRTGEPAG